MTFGVKVCSPELTGSGLLPSQRSGRSEDWASSLEAQMLPVPSVGRSRAQELLTPRGDSKTPSRDDGRPRPSLLGSRAQGGLVSWESFYKLYD